MLNAKRLQWFAEQEGHVKGHGQMRKPIVRHVGVFDDAHDRGGRDWFRSRLDMRTAASLGASKRTQGLVRVLQVVDRKHERHHHPVDLAHQLLLIDIGELCRGGIAMEKLQRLVDIFGGGKDLLVHAGGAGYGGGLYFDIVPHVAVPGRRSRGLKPESWKARPYLTILQAPLQLSFAIFVIKNSFPNSVLRRVGPTAEYRSVISRDGRCPRYGDK